MIFLTPLITGRSKCDPLLCLRDPCAYSNDVVSVYGGNQLHHGYQTVGTQSQQGGLGAYPRGHATVGQI